MLSLGGMEAEHLGRAKPASDPSDLLICRPERSEKLLDGFHLT
jgi:hypothetical protein